MSNEESQLSQAHQAVQQIQHMIAQVLIGQQNMVEALLIGILTKGHILLEGAPGLAKTLAIRALSKVLELPFQRVQFTPDLLPSDLVGTEIYSPKTGNFTTRQGPIFTNILLADEINRAPPKVQSALLEAMAEHQVTIGSDTFQLPDPFLVLATQNPLEQEGTYPLPEAQADRFMLKVIVEYPTLEEERQILMGSSKREATLSSLQPIISRESLIQIQNIVNNIHMEDMLCDYIIQIVRATRDARSFGIPVSRYIQFGASPRASLSMQAASKARAFLQGRNFVMPDDIKYVAHSILRHRILLTYEAEAENISPGFIIDNILQHIRTP
jgi:MoxR-like ATPase